MAALILTLIVLVLLVYGLQRNHVRQVRLTRLAGSTDTSDRDAQRVLDDLRTASGVR